jgi:hypothetical protein
MTQDSSSRSSSVSSSSGGENDQRYKRFVSCLVVKKESYLLTHSYNRMKLDELEGSPSSTELAVPASLPAALPNNMKTQAAFVNKLYK